MTSTGGREPPDHKKPNRRSDAPKQWRETVDPAEPNPVTDAMISPRTADFTGTPDGTTCRVCGVTNHAGASYCLNCGVQFRSKLGPEHQEEAESDHQTGTHQGDSLDSDGFIDPDQFAEFRQSRSASVPGDRNDGHSEQLIDAAMEERDAQRTLRIALAALMVVAALVLFLVTFRGGSEATDTSTSTSTTAVDVGTRYRDLVASLSARVDELGTRVRLANDQWDSGTTDYADSLSELRSVAAATRPLMATINQAELPPDADLDLGARLGALAATLSDSADDMVAGLESSDSGEARRSAQTRYGAAADEFVTVADTILQNLASRADE